MNSKFTGADLGSVAEAMAYVADPTLRAGLLAVYRAASAAFGVHATNGPYHVLDEGFGRRAVGMWVGGPVDSFKAWASATLFAECAARLGDGELHAAAEALLLHDFVGGGMVYTAGGPGTAGYSLQHPGERRAVLAGRDAVTVALVAAAAAL